MTELQRFLQQMAGYCLTGDISEHALFFVYGTGGNGKGVFLNTVAGILGDYAATAAMDTFTASQGDRHPTDLAMLRGARLVTAAETEEGRAWAESRIKQLTGGDPITARFMRQDFFTFQPAFKLVIVGNHKPVLRNVDEAARRRFNIIPFTRKPPKPDQAARGKAQGGMARHPALDDRGLPRLAGERPGAARLVRRRRKSISTTRICSANGSKNAASFIPATNIGGKLPATCLPRGNRSVKVRASRPESSKALGDKLSQRGVDTIKKKLNGKTVAIPSVLRQGC